MNKIISTTKSSVFVGIGIMIGLCTAASIDDMVSYGLIFMQLLSLGGIGAYAVTVIFLPHLNNKPASEDKRLLYAQVSLIASVSISVYVLYIYHLAYVDRTLIMSTLLSLWEYLRAENLYTADKQWKTKLNNIISIQFITLLLASCLPIGLQLAQQLWIKVLTFL